MQILENIIILIIIGLQIYSFYRTYKMIKVFNSIFPSISGFGIVDIFIPESEMNLPPQKILLNTKKYLVKESESLDSFEDSVVKKIKVSLVHSGYHSSNVLEKIKESLNTYLLRNRNAVPEFNLVKDIVDRNCDSLEEQINSSISVPLYLGLLGTLFGIIIGLINISTMSENSANPPETTDMLTKAIPVLLGGVRVAMFASFIGLMLTILNSSYFFKNAKVKLYNNKNDFFTFLQIELFPILNQGMSSSFNSLQLNLQKFNREFTANITELGVLMYQNHDALIAQEKVLTSLESIDINEFAKANVKVLKELQKATESFDSFNKYVVQLNQALGNTSIVISSISKLIEKTESMNELAHNINISFNENKQLMSFLQSHYNSLDESKQMLVNSVGGVNKILKDALGQLEEFTKESINELQQVIIREVKLMDSEYPEKWKKMDRLDNLVSLNDIKADISQIKLSNAGQIASIQSNIKELKAYLANIDDSLFKLNNKKSLTEKMIAKIQAFYGKHIAGK